MRIKILLLILFLTPISISSQQIISSNNEIDEINKMRWFEEAKLGIFIHCGIYSVNGISESWSFFNGYISHSDYMKQLDGFNAKKYDPKENKEYVVGIEKTENEQARFDVTLAMLFSGSNDANGGFKAGFKSHDLY